REMGCVDGRFKFWLQNLMLQLLGSTRFPPHPRDPLARREHVGRLDVPGEAEPLEQLDETEPDIGLAGIETVPRRCGEGVMVVVPALAHRRPRGPRHVVRLDRT